LRSLSLRLELRVYAERDRDPASEIATKVQSSYARCSPLTSRKMGRERQTPQTSV
jgi:hypothetical protein